MKLFLTALSVVALSSSLWSQEFPKAEIYGGYSYLNVDTNGLSKRQSANGWEGAVSGNFNRWLAVEFDVNGYYKSYDFPNFLELIPGATTVKVRDYSYLAGPRFNFRPLFVHALLGGDHLTGSALGLSASQDGLAGAFGGGGEWKVARQVYVRMSADYVFSRHNILGGPSFTQNNFRVSAGLVYAFGGKGAPIARQPERAGAAPTPVPNSSEAALLGVVGYATDDGFKVTSVPTGSPAEQIFLKPGDVISKIDGKDVHSGRDVESAIAATEGERITVSGLTQTAVGMLAFEREVKVR